MAVGALFVGLFGGYSISSDSIPAYTPTTAVTPVTLQKPTTGSVPGDGIFRVGPDVEPGLYRSVANDQRCSWARSTDATGEADSVQAHDSSLGSAYVSLSAGDFFDSSGCHTWRLVK